MRKYVLRELAPPVLFTCYLEIRGVNAGFLRRAAACSPAALHRGARSPYTEGLYPPPPPATRYYEYNHQSLGGVNSFYVPGLQRLPSYEWKPTQSISPVLPHRTPTMTNGRKRQIDEYSPHVVKRQRLDSSSDPFIGPSSIRSPPPRPPDQVLAGSSRSGFDRRYPSPHSRPHPQVPAVPESSNSLQTYAKDKLSDQMVELFEACQQQSSDLARKEMCRTRLQEDIQHVYAAYVERTQLIRAKVPILRFREKGSDLEFDLNVNNTVGIRNTFLLRSYAYADLRIRPMILVVKKWARHNQINDASKGTLSSYTLVLMVLHYLQTLNEPVLPSLQRDYPECFNPLMDIDTVPDGPKHIPPYISRNQSSLGELLLGFLKYYATYFRWDEQVISVREARALPKTNSYEWKNKFICVEEPFERNNVARAVHEKIKFDIIKAQFVESWRILQQRKDLNSILPVRAISNKESSRR
ncbi:Poly(A) RNA polymerase GLD2 [Nibea albiflora]|uniref:Poly(A) RNA polymerase GLD2 n=1 Tax=Nibea albiflora TaxID=240163 RepID=A0ACB7FC66_NIBAL|nr:Poly(A) RNA polymerase GLD2 [Nibea albiflora]